MKSPFVKTYLAAGVLLVLGAYVVFVELRRPASPETPREKVFTFDKARVKEVTIAPKDGETIRLLKEGGGWRMTAPLAVAADAFEADSIVQSLESLEVQDAVAEGVANLAEYGLESPRLALSVLVEGATEPMKVVLGDKVPAGSGTYAKRPTQPRVFTVPGYMEGSFTKKPFDLRDRDLLHVKRDAVKTIEVTGPEGSYALARDDRGEWAFTKPIATLAGRWAVDGLLGSLESLRIDSVAAEEAKDLKPFGLAKPARRVVLGLADGATKSLEIGGGTKEKRYHAREAGSRLVGLIPSGLVEDLARGMKELRAKRLLDVAVYEVEGFDVEAEGVKRVYARSSTKDSEGIEVYKWKRTSPEAKDLDTNTVQDVLFKLGGVEVQEFIDTPSSPEAHGLAQPALKVALRFGAGKPPGWFELGQKDGASYARRSGDTAVLKLDPSKADDLVKAFKGL